MKKFLFILAGAALFCALLFVFSFYAGQKTTDTLISRCLTSKFGIRIEAQQVRPAGWGKVSFRNLQIGGTEDQPSWLSAQEGEVFFSDFPQSLSTARLDLKSFSVGGAVRKNASVFMDLFSSRKAELETSVAWPKFKSAHFFIRKEGEGLSVRIAGVQSEDFLVGGAARFSGRQLLKMNVRWSVPRSVYSKWPDLAVRKMIPEKNGWRAAGLAYGGQTWTLRGWRGPLLQFSGSLSANSH